MRKFLMALLLCSAYSRLIRTNYSYNNEDEKALDGIAVPEFIENDWAGNPALTTTSPELEVGPLEFTTQNITSILMEPATPSTGFQPVSANESLTSESRNSENEISEASGDGNRVDFESREDQDSGDKMSLFPKIGGRENGDGTDENEASGSGSIENQKTEGGLSGIGHISYCTSGGGDTGNEKTGYILDEYSGSGNNENGDSRDESIQNALNADGTGMDEASGDGNIRIEKIGGGESGHDAIQFEASGDEDMEDNDSQNAVSGDGARKNRTGKDEANNDKGIEDANIRKSRNKLDQSATENGNDVITAIRRDAGFSYLFSCSYDEENTYFNGTIRSNGTCGISEWFFTAQWDVFRLQRALEIVGITGTLVWVVAILFLIIGLSLMALGIIILLLLIKAVNHIIKSTKKALEYGKIYDTFEMS